jgi:hypothetical protein
MPMHTDINLAKMTIAVIIFIFLVLGSMVILGLQNKSDGRNDQYTLNDKPKLRPTPTESPIQDLYLQTSYYSEPYGFSFQYSSGWTILYPEATPGIQFIMSLSPTGSGVLCMQTDTATSSCDLQQTSVSVIENDTHQTPDQFLDYMGLPTSVERVSTTVNGYTGIKTLTKNENYEYESIYVSANDKIFLFTNIRSLNNTYAQELFSQLINSTTFFTSKPSADNREKPDYYISTTPTRVPYEGLTYKTITITDFKPLEAELTTNDYQTNDEVIDGYTFTATQGDSYEFLATENKSLSFIGTEMYGSGPAIKMQTRLAWTAPQTGTYYYIVKGKDLYGGTPSNKFGRYTLTITPTK